MKVGKAVVSSRAVGNKAAPNNALIKLLLPVENSPTTQTCNEFCRCRVLSAIALTSGCKKAGICSNRTCNVFINSTLM